MLDDGLEISGVRKDEEEQPRVIMIMKKRNGNGVSSTRQRDYL
jgi:hypothetical protein